MEKKTIGSFIAALRKANGLTQRELAEKLNVSDKAVSRWERDENAPDLMLIPVIAEIFGVTSDELLRGERKKTDAPIDGSGERSGDGEAKSPREEKQIRHILNSSLVKLRQQNFASVGVAGIGFIAAMICNFGFNRAYLGFGLACCFYLIAAVLLAIFSGGFFSRMSVNEFDSSDVNSCKRSAFKMTCRTASIIIALLPAVLPLVFVGDAYAGLADAGALLTGVFGAGAVLLLCAFLHSFISDIAIKRNVFTMNEAEAEIQKQNNRKKVKTSVITAIVLAITLLAQGVVNNIGYEFFRQGRSFDSYEDFKAYAEEPVVANGEIVENIVTAIVNDGRYENPDTSIAAVPNSEQTMTTALASNDSESLTDDENSEDSTNENSESDEDEPTALNGVETSTQSENGDEDTPEQPELNDDRYWLGDEETIELPDGTVLCTYRPVEGRVRMIEYGEESNNYLPITVYSDEDLMNANYIMDDINSAFALIYIAEIAVAAAIYMKRRVKAK